MNIAHLDGRHRCGYGTIRHYIWIFLARNEKGMDLKGCFKSDFNVCAIANADYMNLDP